MLLCLGMEVEGWNKRRLCCYDDLDLEWKGGTREDFAVAMIWIWSGRVENETDSDNKR